MGPEEMSKLSCKALVRAQTYLYGQVASNRGSLQLIVVAVKFLQAVAAQLESTLTTTGEIARENADSIDFFFAAFGKILVLANAFFYSNSN